MALVATELEEFCGAHAIALAAAAIADEELRQRLCPEGCVRAAVESFVF